MSDSNFLKASPQNEPPINNNESRYKTNTDEITIVNPTSIPIINSSTDHRISSTTTDPWHRYYAPLIAEFMASLFYTLFSNLLGIFGIGDSAARLSIALMDGALQYSLISTFGVISGGHFNPAITIAELLTLNVRLVAGISMIFVQIFGSFFGALLTRTTLSGVGFMDAFVALGIRKPNYEQHGTIPPSLFDPNQQYNDSGENSIYSNRFQMFLLETLLSTLLVSTYLITSTYESLISTASSVGAIRALIALVGLYSLGQSSNLARQLANNAICSIFLMDDRVWRFFYISFFSALSSAIISAGIFWLIRGSSPEKKK